MNKFISVIIPSYNRSSTIGKCLEAVFSSKYEKYEVVVVDDCSTDDSADIIRKYPCTLIRLDKNSGTSAARNAGAKNSRGEILFFIDSDCLLQEDTLSLVDKAFRKYAGTDAVIGGTYTKLPFDDTFFSTFQSVFINYSETKRADPDYVPGHAMVIDKKLFQKSGGFSEDFLPILEDVEFSHRLRRSGCKLVMAPEIVVRHIFRFTLAKSFNNAFRKSSYWTYYSLNNKDLLKDSGTASTELKINVAANFFMACMMLSSLLFNRILFIGPVPFILGADLWMSRRLLGEFYRAKGFIFTAGAMLYYTLLYPIPVGAGAVTGIAKFVRQKIIFS